MNRTIARPLFAIAIFTLGCAAEGDDPADPLASDLRIAGDLTYYPTPVIVKPPVAPTSVDLKMDGNMRFIPGGSTVSVQINVHNIGNVAATASSGLVNINGFTASASLHQYWGGTATAPAILNPGERGYLLANVPASLISPCGKYLTHIDTSRTLQFAAGGAPDPFVNDEADVATQCLQWTTPISTDNFPISDPLINGNTIGRIVSSITVGRKDGLKCSQCHHATSGLPYSPPVAQGGSASIWPDDVINGRTWAGPDGWAERFIHMPTDVPGLVSSKPSYLQMLLQTWRDHGERFNKSIVADPGTVKGVFTF